ncbi:tryptophan-rich sensory protein [Paenibacillus sp. MMS18-CY102]|uniref:tryptophan-rich sensory protein n=1 Tax=Paenibacillus sp. MMS18-CY102 TaxID=2682849 RepID=UPI0013667BEA|nr:tryptophan-rich sensory protein [Paenibacillus sp. MMS18-CY102]MWC28945.1 tryptophan-rich sensory protein [Paenibacillus sp. MMS18-CY102]
MPNPRYRLLNIAMLIVVLIVNALADRLPIGGVTTGEVSAQFPTLVTPASYAFIIWTLIYALLIGFAIYQMTPIGASKPTVQAIGPWFAVTCALNVAWLLLWHYYKISSSAYAMLALLLSLVYIYTRTRLAASEPTFGERLFVWLPFSLYFGWITIAAIANLSVVLMVHGSGWNSLSLSPAAWAIGFILIATILGCLIGWLFRDSAYPAVIAWGLIAIAVKQHATFTVAIVAIAGAIVVLMLSFGILARRIRKRA